jgi:hypothetical protein
MVMSILLEEDDLFTMPAELRETLLHWYFGGDRRRSTPPAIRSAAPLAVAPISRTAAHAATVLPSLMAVDVDDSERVTFAKLVEHRLLTPGQEVLCRSLKRQREAGKPKYLKGAVVATNGTVEYNGAQYANPSRLAVEIVRQTGGKPKALNGFDYLFVESTRGPIPLKKLRDRLKLNYFLAEASVEDAREYGLETTVEDHLPHIVEGTGRPL